MKYNRPSVKGAGSSGEVAQKATGMTLHYFDGDYLGTELTAGLETFEGRLNTMQGGDVGLYNGNIAGWAQQYNDGQATTRTLLRGYRYDRLNRIKSSKTSLDGNNVNNKYASFATSYDFDRNGNLLSLTRRDSNGTKFDDFTYHYPQINGKTVSNQLTHVDDAEADQLRPDDIDDQDSLNYVYDKRGNLA